MKRLATLILMLVFLLPNPVYAITFATSVNSGHLSGSLLTGLTAYYAMEGSAADSIDGNGLSTNSIVFSTIYGKINQGGTFDGADSYGYITLPSSFKTTSVTYSVWTKLGIIATVYVMAGQPEGSFTDGRGFILAVNGSGNAVSIVGDGSGTFTRATGSTTLSTNIYYLLTGTYDGATIKIYVNGVLDGSTSFASSIQWSDNGANGPVPATFYLGAAHDGTNSGATPPNAGLFGGELDEAGVWSRALTAAEVYTLYNFGLGLTY